MRNKRTTTQKQLALIQECRQSGMTTYEWCEQNGINLSTFYGWQARLKRTGEIDSPAVIPTVIRKQSEQPDIVKIEIEGNKPVQASTNTAITPDSEKEPLLTTQTGIPVMEVVLSGVHLRVTNEVSPKLLADTIRLLRGAGC